MVTNPEFTGYSVVVELTDPSVLQAGRHYTATGMYTHAPPDTVTMVAFERGAFLLAALVPRQPVRMVTGIDEPAAMARCLNRMTSSHRS